MTRKVRANGAQARRSADAGPRSRLLDQLNLSDTLSIGEAALYADMSKSSLRRKALANEIACIKKDKQLFFRPEALDAWLRKHVLEMPAKDEDE